MRIQTVLMMKADGISGQKHFAHDEYFVRTSTAAPTVVAACGFHPIIVGLTFPAVPKSELVC